MKHIKIYIIFLQSSKAWWLHLIWNQRQVEVVDLGKDLQKEEKPSRMSLGRGRVNGGSTLLMPPPPVKFSLPPARREHAKAGCRLLKPSTMHENAPIVRQLWSRACGAPEMEKKRKVNILKNDLTPPITDLSIYLLHRANPLANTFSSLNKILIAPFLHP